MLVFSQLDTSTRSPIFITGAKGGGDRASRADGARVRVELCRATRGESPVFSMAGARMPSSVAATSSTGGGSGGGGSVPECSTSSPSLSPSLLSAGGGGMSASEFASRCLMRSGTKSAYLARNSASTDGCHRGSSASEHRQRASRSTKALRPLVATRTVLVVSKRVGPKATMRPCCFTSQMPMVMVGIFSLDRPYVQSIWSEPMA